MEDLLIIIDKIPNPQKKYLKNLFKHILTHNHSYNIVEIDADTRFILANEPCNMIWILVEGKVRAVEEQITGDVYVFSEFSPPEIFGDMEGLAGIFYYKSTLTASTDCSFIKIPVNCYLDWILHDSEALSFRVKEILRRTFQESQDNRTFLFLDGIDRIILYLTRYYKKNEKNKICIVHIKRQQIADETGFCVKTINRAMKYLLNKELITLNGRKAIIHENQYLQLLELLNKNISN